MIWHPMSSSRSAFSGFPPDQLLEREALQQFHHNERLTARFANFVNSTDVGMVEGRSRSRFPTKPLEHL